MSLLSIGDVGNVEIDRRHAVEYARLFGQPVNKVPGKVDVYMTGMVVLPMTHPLHRHIAADDVEVWVLCEPSGNVAVQLDRTTIKFVKYWRNFPRLNTLSGELDGGFTTVLPRTAGEYHKVSMHTGQQLLPTVI